jgi:DNA polymerase-3 subunit epsilon
MKLAVIDIETTGFLEQNGKIVEIGIVELDLDNGNIEPLLHYVCYEDGITKEEIANSWIIKNSNLTAKQIRFGINLNILKSKIQTIANEYSITAFNRVFDISFLIAKLGIEFTNLYPCPMLELTPIMKLPGKRGYKWPNVNEAYKYFFPNSDYNEKHRALDDATHEAEIIYKLHLLKQNNNELCL